MRAEKSYAFPLALLKWLAVAAIVVFIFMISGRDTVSAADFADVSAAVSAAADKSNMQDADNQMIRRLYGLDPAEYEGIFCLYPTTNMGAEELFLINGNRLILISDFRKIISA